MTRNGVKKQKRYLLDTISNLYKKLWNNNSGLISYQTFCRLRPFWVVTPKINKRDSCLCIKHANIDLKLTALHCRKILSYNNHNKLLENTCCNRYDEQCLSRECLRCVNKNSDYKEFDDTKPISFKKWIAEKQDYKDPKLNKVRSIIKYVKRNLTVRPCELIQDLHEELDEYYRHERNILHQYKALRELKENLNDKEVAILMDFSENYCTKYNKEIQAYHFGGSKLQLSLHTVVVYTKDYEILLYCFAKHRTFTSCYMGTLEANFQNFIDTYYLHPFYKRRIRHTVSEQNHVPYIGYKALCRGSKYTKIFLELFGEWPWQGCRRWCWRHMQNDCRCHRCCRR